VVVLFVVHLLTTLSGCQPNPAPEQPVTDSNNAVTLPQLLPGGVSAAEIMAQAERRGWSASPDPGPDGQLAVVVTGDVGFGAQRAAAHLVNDKLVRWVLDGAVLVAIEAELGAPITVASPESVWYSAPFGALVLAKDRGERGWTMEWQYLRAMVDAGVISQEQLRQRLEALGQL